MASLTDDNIRTVPVFCNDANSKCLVYEELKNGVLVTTPPAPITQPSPIITPPQIVTSEAIQQSLPITIGFAYSKYRVRSCGQNGCIGVAMVQFVPKSTWSPTVIEQQSNATKLKFVPHYFNSFHQLEYCSNAENVTELFSANSLIGFPLTPYSLTVSAAISSI